jgi:hypothetical protein
MKKIIKPQEPEEAVYYSDFSGKLLPESNVFGPPVILKIEYNYGSEQDGDSFELHLDDEDAKKILQFLKNNVK